MVMPLAAADPPAADPAADAVAHLVRAEMQKQHIPGLALLVSHNGRPIRAEGYGLSNVVAVGGRLKNQEWVSPSLNTTADGSLYFSVLDLAKWDAALYTEKLLRRTSLQQMWRVAALRDGKPNAGRPDRCRTDESRAGAAGADCRRSGRDLSAEESTAIAGSTNPRLHRVSVRRHYPRHSSSRSRMRRIARDGSIYHLTSIDQCWIMG
jgi:CubicO group peptidase (beta-lactamase class C family)